MKKLLLGLLAGATTILTSCASPEVTDYAAETPKLDIRQYLNGDLGAWGVLFDHAGKQSKRFHVTMTGTWQGDVGTLKEHFVFSDGTTDDRTWTIRFTGPDQFTGSAHDVIGEAKGQQRGNAMNMQYTLRAKRDNGSTIDLSMDDWMYLLNDQMLINRTTMRKLGVPVGELTIAFRKKS